MASAVGSQDLPQKYRGHTLWTFGRDFGGGQSQLCSQICDVLIEAPVVLILSLALQVLSLATQGGKLELPALCGQSPSESPVLYSETRPTNAEIDAREQGCWYMQEHAQTKSCKRPKLPGPSLCPKYDADSKILVPTSLLCASFAKDQLKTNFPGRYGDQHHRRSSSIRSPDSS